MEQSPNMIAGKDFTAEPVFPNSDFSLRSIDLSTGVSMEYVECGETNNDVIIFLHGWLDSWYSWSQVVGQFTDRYHVFVPSLRGHGLSSKPDTSYSMKEHALDLRAFMDQLGIASSSFVGHSMGAVICQQLGFDVPNRVEKIVLVGGAANITKNRPVTELVDLVSTLQDPVDQTMVKEFVQSLFYRDFSDNIFFVDRLVREELLVEAVTWRNGLDSIMAVDNRPDLPRIKSPTLVIWGDQDQLFSEQDQTDLIEGIPNSELLIWENVGHAMQWEDPQRMVRDVREFLSLSAH